MDRPGTIHLSSGRLIFTEPESSSNGGFPILKTNLI